MHHDAHVGIGLRRIVGTPASSRIEPAAIDVESILHRIDRTEMDPVPALPRYPALQCFRCGLDHCPG
eukprot:4717924-Pyramimonas_sp.AAC.1